MTFPRPPERNPRPHRHSGLICGTRPYQFALEHYQCTAFHPVLEFFRVGSPSSVYGECGRLLHPEQRHLHGRFALLSEKVLRKYRSKSYFRSAERYCAMAASEPSHWCLRTYLPCWFITIRLSVASTVFGMENSLLAFSVIVPFMSYISLPTCKTSVHVRRVPPYWYVSGI